MLTLILFFGLLITIFEVLLSYPNNFEKVQQINKDKIYNFLA